MATPSPVCGHVESDYSQASGQWTPLRFVSDPYIRIHGLAPALNYGQQAYEGLKAFRGPDGNSISIFRPDRNARRLQHSAEVASMPPLPEALFLQACRSAVALNAAFVPPHASGAALYLRPQLYGSGPQLGLTPADEYSFRLFVIPVGAYHGAAPVKALILDSFDRAAPRGTGHAKVGGNYAPVMRWSDKAKRDGYAITLHLDSASHQEVDEFSTSAFIGVRQDGDQVTLVVPDSPSVIDSVTSDSVQQMARSYGWATEKRPIPYRELPDFTEVMAAGTAALLVPIRSITRLRPTDRLPAGPRVSRHADAETVAYMDASQTDPGPVCRKLLAHLRALQSGEAADEFGWRHLVTEADTQIDGANACQEAPALSSPSSA